jgi:hypothetical protein
MPKTSSPAALHRLHRYIAVIVAAVFILTSVSACSESAGKPEITESVSPVVEVSSSPVVTPSPTLAPTEEPTATPAPTPSPKPDVSFPPLKANDDGSLSFPQVVADKTSVDTGEPVYFKIITSEKVKSIQTVIDGDTGKIYTDYSTDNGVRIWQTKIQFTKGGTRKIQFKCNMTSGGKALIPKTPIKIDATFKYTAESTSKTISKGKTVTFTLKTPDTTDSVYAVVDGVNQDIVYTKPESEKNGVKVWKVRVTFFKLGEREVKFNACIKNKVKKTFPDTGITIIVQESV